MDRIIEILTRAIEVDVSDIFIVAGCPLAFKIKGQIYKQSDEKLMVDDTRFLVEEIYKLKDNRSLDNLEKNRDDDFSFSVANLGRFRVNVYYQRDSLAAVLRVVKFDLPDYHELSIPKTVINLSTLQKGLVLVTGSAGCGKSTTLACIIDEINKTRNAHIITIEDPIEYLHRHNKSIVSQREVFHDASNYAHALRAALREAPNVILVGEMRDLETIQTALSAAETGHLVLSTLHTVGAAETINRIIDVFPPSQQHQIKIQLSMVLHSIVSQQLIPSLDNQLIPAFEILMTNSAIKTQIRDGKTHQIDNYIQSGKKEGMLAMDDSIYQLFKDGKISVDNAMLYASNSEVMAKKVQE